MKIPLLLLALLTVSTVGLAADLRTWTDTQGRTIKGEFVEANATDVIVKRDDDVQVNIPRKMLSSDDLAFADKAQASRPIKVSLEVVRSKYSSKPTPSADRVYTAEEWGYIITLSNKGRLVGHDLRIAYRVFIRGKVGTGTAISLAHMPITAKAGSETVEKLDVTDKVTVRTTPIPVTTEAYLSGQPIDPATNTLKRVNVEVEGIWVRVYQGDQIIAEFVSSETVRKEGWADSAKK